MSGAGNPAFIGADIFKQLRRITNKKSKMPLLTLKPDSHPEPYAGTDQKQASSVTLLVQVYKTMMQQNCKYRKQTNKHTRLEK